MFGFAGMILGVPICGVAYYICKRLVESKLRSRQYPTATTAYSASGIVMDPDTHMLVPAENLTSDHAKQQGEDPAQNDTTNS